ncbi:MAG: hypothetical protein ACYCU0_14855 [Solirubrobacteraceae bacterium]
MLDSIAVTAAILIGLGIAMRPPKEDTLVKRRPYGNRYSDASAAREEPSSGNDARRLAAARGARVGAAVRGGPAAHEERGRAA